jgi:predicted GH43/DUF377 family glycosyl hydrolase
MLLNPKFWYESRKIGLSGAPIRTSRGWLMIYHGVEDGAQGNVYRASAALLDLSDPTKVIGQLSEPLFSPHASWEKFGTANNVVFPSGSVLYDDNDIYIYYGAADTSIAVASINIDELVQELITHKVYELKH